MSGTMLAGWENYNITLSLQVIWVGLSLGTCLPSLKPSSLILSPSSITLFLGTLLSISHLKTNFIFYIV